MSSSTAALPQFNRTSKILAGPYGPRKSGKMDAIVILLKERGLKVIVDLSQPLSPSSMPSMTTGQMIYNYSYADTDVVVCYNVPSVDHLREFLNLHTLTGKQIILSTDLGAQELMPLAKELASHKFDVHFTSTWKERILPNGLPEDYSLIQRNFAENLLLTAVNSNAIHSTNTMPTTSTAPTTLNSTSVILSGPDRSGKTTKMRAVVDLAKEAGLKVGLLHTGMQLSSTTITPTQEGILQLQLNRFDIIVCDDNRITGTIEGLQDFLSATSTNANDRSIQFILSTTLTAEEIMASETRIDGSKFNIVTTSVADFCDDSKPYGRSWACRHFLGKAPISLPIVASTQDAKDEEKKDDKSKCESKDEKATNLGSFTSVLLVRHNGVCDEYLEELCDYAYLAGLKIFSLRACDIDRNSKFEVHNAAVDVICCRDLRKAKDIINLLDKYDGDTKQFFLAACIDGEDLIGIRLELDKRKCAVVFLENLDDKNSRDYDELVTKLKTEWVAAETTTVKDVKDEKSADIGIISNSTINSTEPAFLNQRSLLLIGANTSFKFGKLDKLIELARKCLRNVRVVTSQDLERKETFLPPSVSSDTNTIPAHVDIIVCMDLESTDHLYAATKLKLPGQQIFVGSRTFSHFELMKNAFGKHGFDCYEQKLLTEQERTIITSFFGQLAESTMTALGNADWAINWAMREAK